MLCSAHLFCTKTKEQHTCLISFDKKGFLQIVTLVSKC